MSTFAKLQNRKGIIFLVGLFLCAAILWYLFFYTETDPEKVATLETTFSVLEADGVEFYFNMDWCKVLVYGDVQASETVDSTVDEDCGTRLTGRTGFTSFAGIDQNIFNRLTETYRSEYREVEARFVDGKITYAVFHKDCSFCRTRYVYDPGYTLPDNIEGELLHVPINENWYRVEEDWN